MPTHYPSKRKGAPSKAKAAEMLHHGEVHGQPLTEAQRRFFGAILSAPGSLSDIKGRPAGKERERRRAPRDRPTHLFVRG